MTMDIYSEEEVCYAEEEAFQKGKKQGALEELERQEKELIENIIPMEKKRIKECDKKGLKSISEFHKENIFYEDVFLNGIRLRIKELKELEEKE